MNSLELYTQYLSASRTQPLTPEQKTVQISTVIKKVFEELNTSPFESPFIAETQNIIKNRMPLMPWFGKSIVIIDAFTIIIGVRNFFNDANYIVLADREILSYSKNFFQDGDYGQYEKSLIAEIQQNLSIVKKFLDERKQSPVQQSFSVEVQPQPAAEIQTLGNTNYPPQNSLQNPMPKPQPTILRQTQSTGQPVQIPSQMPAQSSTQTSAKSQGSSLMQSYAAEKNAQIELQKYIVAAEEERTKQLKMRREDNRKKVSAWHDGQSNLIQSVRELQRPAQTLLEQFRNFSNNITENYVIRFAMNQIDLFNLIAENFASHLPQAEKSRNNDYYNAVYNYESYLDMIIDALADFGVEEISSNPGTRFDGKIHDVKNTKNFSPQTATVKRSLRQGFRYGDLILQREAVEV